MQDKTFSLADMVRAHCAETWRSIPSTEQLRVDQLNRKFGQLGNNFERVPNDVLNTRDLTAASASGGGYLAPTAVQGYVESLTPLSTVLALGATPIMLKAGAVNIPRGASGVSTTWATNEATQTTESQPVFGQLPVIRHSVSAYVELSRQVLLQSDADYIIRLETATALAAELDSKFLGGAGTSGTPLGLVNASGLLTFTGASLNYAALISAMQQVSDANSVRNPQTLGWAATPTVAGLLKQRYRVATYAEQPLWKGQIARGSIEDAPAIGSKSVPTGTLIFGDWSTLLIAQWDGGIAVQVDPYTKFQTGIVGIKAIIDVDVVPSVPTSFAIATSVT